MRNKRRNSSRRDGSILAAVVVALATAGTAAAVQFTANDDIHDVAAIATPAVVAALVAAIATRRLAARRLAALTSADRDLWRAVHRLEDEQAERSILRDFGHTLDGADSEAAALKIANDTFRQHLSPQSTELHLIDRTDPVLSLALATGDHRTLPDHRPSPWTSLAGRESSTLVYRTTSDPEVCPHLASRVPDPVSAIAVPLMIGGDILGVLYAFGQVGHRPGDRDVTYVEDFAAVLAGRLAVIRSTTDHEPDDRIDRLTGLPDRATTQRRLLAMIDDQRSFTIAVADIDNLGQINDVAGRTAGDRSLEIVAATARRAVRPIDVVGRIGGDELLIIFPDTTPDDAVKALERLREALFLTQSTEEVAAFTLSIGVIGSSYGGPIDKILVRAADALHQAKFEGGNRVVLAPAAAQEPSV